MIRWSITSIAAGTIAGRDHGADRVGGVTHPVERQQHRPHGRPVLREGHRDPGGDAERALAADEHPAQVEAERLGIETTEHRHFTVGQHDLDRLHVGVGDTVGEAMGPAGVVGHVAADRAHLLARRIGCEVEAERREVLRQIEVDDAGLDPGDAIVEIDVENPVHPGERDDDRRTEWDRPAGEPGARTTGHDGSPVPCGDPHDRLHVAGRGGEADRTGHTAAEDGRVAAQQRAFGRVDAHAVHADRRAQVGDDRIIDGVARVVDGLVGASAPPRTEHHCSQYDGDLVVLTVGSVRARPGQTRLIENAGMTRGAAEVTYSAERRHDQRLRLGLQSSLPFGFGELLTSASNDSSPYSTVMSGFACRL